MDKIDLFVKTEEFIYFATEMHSYVNNSGLVIKNKNIVGLEFDISKLLVIC